MLEYIKELSIEETGSITLGLRRGLKCLDLLECIPTKWRCARYCSTIDSIYLTQDVALGRAGDICALFGIECASGDTFTTKECLHLTMVRL